MNAILVCVDMADLASISLPWNRNHFDQVTVVTSTKDAATEAVAKANNCQVFKTDLFWQGGSGLFRKWLALETALRETGLQDSHDWLTVMDVDILWPKSLCLERRLEGSATRPSMMKGQLWGPYRRMWREWPKYPSSLMNKHVDWYEPSLNSFGVPGEEWWKEFPQSPQQTEWAGFSLIFHPQDEVLRQRPWFDVSWTSCSGADSFFQMRWEGKNKVRPKWEVLHLGEDHVNWLGRTSAYSDGTLPEGAAERKAKLREMMGKRRQQTAENRFEHEKIKE